MGQQGVWSDVEMTMDIFKFRILNFGAIVSCVQSPTRAQNSTTVVMTDLNGMKEISL